MKTICKIFRRLVNTGELSVSETFTHFPLPHKTYPFSSSSGAKVGRPTNFRLDFPNGIWSPLFRSVSTTNLQHLLILIYAPKKNKCLMGDITPIAIWPQTTILIYLGFFQKMFKIQLWFFLLYKDVSFLVLRPKSVFWSYLVLLFKVSQNFFLFDSKF